MQTYVGYIFITVAAISWACIGNFARITLAEGLEPLETSFWRALFAGFFMLSHAFYIKDVKIHSIKHIPAFLFFGVFSIGAFFVSYQYAVKEVGVAVASVLMYTAPIWVALFSRFIFGLSLTKTVYLSIIIAIIGVSCISFSQESLGAAEGSFTQSLSFVGIVVGLLSGFLYATHYVIMRKYLPIYSAFTLYGYGLMIAAICILPFAQIRFNYSIFSWLSILGMALLSTYLAYWAYCESMKRLLPTRVAAISNLEPMIAILFAWSIWGENFSLLGWFGIVLILLAVFFQIFDDRKKA